MQSFLENKNLTSLEKNLKDLADRCPSDTLEFVENEQQTTSPYNDG